MRRHDQVARHRAVATSLDSEVGSINAGYAHVFLPIAKLTDDEERAKDARIGTCG
jgi:hypothetical protein